MDSVVLELQREALDRNVPISDLLRKALVVAKKLKITEFESWVTNELNGYEELEDVPEYRQVRGQVKAWNPHHGWQPIMFESHKEQESLSRSSCGQSIAEVESLLEGKSGGSLLAMSYPPKLEQQLRRSIGFETQITMMIPATMMVRITDAARTIVLNWSLKLEEDGILGEGLSFTSREKETAEKTSYNINMFYGPVESTQIQQQAHQPIQISSPQQPDIEGLQELLGTLNEHLKELKIGPEQEEELVAEIKTLEAQISSPKPKTGVIGESLSSIRTILEGAASSVAAQLLLQLGTLL